MLQLKIEISESMPKLPGPAHYSQFDLYAVLLECIEAMETGELVDSESGATRTAPASARTQTLLDSIYIDPARELQVIVQWRAVDEMLCHSPKPIASDSQQKPQEPKVLDDVFPIMPIFSLAMGIEEQVNVL